MTRCREEIRPQADALRVTPQMAGVRLREIELSRTKLIKEEKNRLVRGESSLLIYLKIY